MIFVAISCRHFELAPCTEAVYLPQRLRLLFINPGFESDLCLLAACHLLHPVTYHSFSCCVSMYLSILTFNKQKKVIEKITVLK